MTDTDAVPAKGASKCPFPFATPVSVPVDGTPLMPSPAFAGYREACPVVPLRYADGHEGLMTTTWDFARAVLGDPRFTITRWRPAPSVTSWKVVRGSGSRRRSTRATDASSTKSSALFAVSRRRR